MSRSFSRAAIRGACLLVFASQAMAADEVSISDAQMRALGITVQKLEQPQEIAGLTYPAQVLLPRTAEYVVSAPVDGLVSQVLAEDSAIVKPGQRLLRFDSPTFGTLQLEVLQATSSERLASQALVRAKELEAEGVIPRRRVEEAEAAAGNALAQLANARAAMRLAGADEGGIERLIKSGTLLDQLAITAKKAGTVLKVEVKPGQRVSAGDVLMRIGDVSRLWLEIQVPSEQARRWKPGTAVSVVNRQATARVLSSAATVESTQTVTLRAEVDAGAGYLRPGEFVQARMPFADSQGAWGLPLASVVRRDEQAYVFVHTARGFAARPVTVAASAGQSVSVSGALEPGDSVAVSGLAALKGAWLGEGGGG